MSAQHTPVTQAEVEAALKAFDGGLVRKDDPKNARGYTTHFLPMVAMREALEAFALGRTPNEIGEEG